MSRIRMLKLSRNQRYEENKDAKNLTWKQHLKK